MRAGVRLAAVALAAVLALGGCAGPPQVFRSDHASPLLTAPPLNQTIAGGVFVAPVAGVEAQPFRQAVADALVRRNVPAGVATAGALGATLTATPGEATAAGRGYVDVTWRLERSDGALLDAFIVPTPLDFRIERPETKAAVDQVARRLARLLGPREAPAAAQILVATPPARTEGFADGGPLARAMATALAGRGFQPGAGDDAAATVRAHARVSSSADDPDMVDVTIRWAVLDRDGAEVGAAEQANTLPRDMAGDGLAAIAADAAAAAAESVAGLIRLAAQPHGDRPSTAAGAS